MNSIQKSFFESAIHSSKDITYKKEIFKSYWSELKAGDSTLKKLKGYNNILDFLPVIESQASNDLVRDSLPHENIFNDTGLGVDSV